MQGWKLQHLLSMQLGFIIEQVIKFQSGWHRSAHFALKLVFCLTRGFLDTFWLPRGHYGVCFGSQEGNVAHILGAHKCTFWRPRGHLSMFWLPRQYYRAQFHSQEGT